MLQSLKFNIFLQLLITIFGLGKKVPVRKLWTLIFAVSSNRTLFFEKQKRYFQKHKPLLKIYILKEKF